MSGAARVSIVPDPPLFGLSFLTYWLLIYSLPSIFVLLRLLDERSNLVCFGNLNASNPSSPHPAP